MSPFSSRREKDDDVDDVEVVEPITCHNTCQCISCRSAGRCLRRPDQPNTDMRRTELHHMTRRSRRTGRRLFASGRRVVSANLLVDVDNSPVTDEPLRSMFQDWLSFRSSRPSSRTRAVLVALFSSPSSRSLTLRRVRDSRLVVACVWDERQSRTRCRHRCRRDTGRGWSCF